MHVIVVGCGRVGSTLAYELFKQGHQVAVIDHDPAAFDNLPLDFRGRTIEGDVLSQNVLQRAEIGTADALATVTNSDTLNALVAHIARTEYKVSHVVARNYDPTQRPLQEAFGIPIVGSAGWGVRRIEELISEDPLSLVYQNREAGFALYQLEVGQNWDGHALQELFPDGNIMLMDLKRSGQSLPLADTFTLQTGDMIYLSAAEEEITALRQRLCGEEG